jgi:hypothetical protein
MAGVTAAPTVAPTILNTIAPVISTAAPVASVMATSLSSDEPSICEPGGSGLIFPLFEGENDMDMGVRAVSRSTLDCPDRVGTPRWCS